MTGVQTCALPICANVQLTGGTLKALNANGNWSAAMIINNTVTLDTADAGGTARTNVISGNLSGGGTLNVTGTGKLSMNGTITGGGQINVQNGATLSGTGSMGNMRVQSNSVIAAGNSIGTISMENLTLDGGAHIQLEINATNGTAGVDWDWINSTGTTTLSGISAAALLTVDVVNYGGLNGAASPTNSMSWIFLTSANGISGYDAKAFAVTTAGLSGWTNGTWSVTQTGNSLQVNYAAVPEPASAMMLIFGAGVGVAVHRLRRVAMRR